MSRSAGPTLLERSEASGELAEPATSPRPLRPPQPRSAAPAGDPATDDATPDLDLRRRGSRRRSHRPRARRRHRSPATRPRLPRPPGRRGHLWLAALIAGALAAAAPGLLGDGAPHPGQRQRRRLRPRRRHGRDRGHGGRRRPPGHQRGRGPGPPRRARGLPRRPDPHHGRPGAGRPHDHLLLHALGLDALGRRPRRPARHPHLRDHRRRRPPRRPRLRLRQRDLHPGRRRRRPHLRPHALLRRRGRPDRARRRRDRPGRQRGPVHRSAPALRDPPRRQDGRRIDPEDYLAERGVEV